MGMIDMSGQPRSDEELQEAIEVVSLIMVKHVLDTPPILVVHLLCIRQLLQELQMVRPGIKRKREADDLLECCKKLSNWVYGIGEVEDLLTTSQYLHSKELIAQAEQAITKAGGR